MRMLQAARASLLSGAALAGQPAVAAQSFDCVMDPPLVVRVGSAVSGLLDEVTVERGERVRAGQVIARINGKVEEATVELLALRAENSAAIEAQQARLAFTDGRLARMRELHARGSVSAEALDEAEAERVTAASLLALAEMERALAGLELERARAALVIREIRSPVDGIVTDRRLSAGEFVHQEAHVATVVQLDPLHVETFLPVEHFGRIQLGDVAMVRPAPPVQGDHAASVLVVDQVFDAASGTFGVRLALPNPDGVFPAGHRCRVVFGTGGQ